MLCLNHAEPVTLLPPSSMIPSRSCANLEPTVEPTPNLATPIGGLKGRGLVMVITVIISLAITKIF